MSYDFSELFAVDVCLGNHILTAFTDLAAHGPQEFVQFLGRPDAQKVMRHNADSVQGFLKSYIADAKGAVVESAGHRVNQPLLPVCWYGRKPGLAGSDVHLEGPFNKWRTLWNEAGTAVAEIRMLAVALNYDLAFIARDKPALDKLLLAWFGFISDTRAENHKFTVPYTIATITPDPPADPIPGQPIPDIPPAEIRDPKTCAFTDATVAEAGNFYAATTTLEVHAPVIFAKAVTVVDPIRIQFAREPWHGA